MYGMMSMNRLLLSNPSIWLQVRVMVYTVRKCLKLFKTMHVLTTKKKKSHVLNNASTLSKFLSDFVTFKEGKND